MSFNHPLRWSYFFLCGHINMVDYINRVPSFESLSPFPHHYLWFYQQQFYLPLLSKWQPLPGSPGCSHSSPGRHTDEGARLSPWKWTWGRASVWQNYLPWIPSWVTPGSCRIEVKVNYLVFWKFILKGLFCPFLTVWGTLIPQVLK